jgi:thiol-disulfide isomerase/thioredoxin
MKKILNIIISVIVLTTISCTVDYNPKIVKITPEKYLDLRSKIQKKTIIHFWFSYCQPCIKDYPELSKIAIENNIDIINISSDKSDSKMQDNLEIVMSKLKMKDCYIIDFANLYPNGVNGPDILGEFAKRINLKNYTNPYYILLDEHGKVIAENYELSKIKTYIN